MRAERIEQRDDRSNVPGGGEGRYIGEDGERRTRTLNGETTGDVFEREIRG